MYMYYSTVIAYWEIFSAVVNALSLAFQKGFYCKALDWHTAHAFYNPSSFVFSWTYSFEWLFAFKWMQKYINKTYTNKAEAAQYLLLPDIN